MPIRLTLLAHAPTAATRAASFAADDPLDPAGRAAAAACAGALRRVDTVLCSPATAARQTADALGLDPSVHPGLRDLECGAWSGRPLDDIDPAGLAAWLTDPDATPHGGESIRHFLARTADFLRALDPATPRILAISQPGLLRAALVAALGASPAAFWRIDAGPLDRLVLAGEGDRWSLRSLSRLRPDNAK